MNYKLLLNIFSIALCAVFFTQCNDDDDPTASLTGTWQGTLVEYKFRPNQSPIPLEYDDDDFDGTVEFRADNTMTMQYNSQTANGTYTRSGDDLTVNINFTLDFVDLSGSYKIEELTNNTLVISTEREGSFEYPPNSGTQLEGEAKATLHFTKQ